MVIVTYGLQFVINDKTLHLLSSSYHWECRSGSGHRYEISSGDDENCQLRQWHPIGNQLNLHVS